MTDFFNFSENQNNKNMSNLVRENVKTILVDEIIRLRVLNNIKVDFEKIKPATSIRMWLFQHNFRELMDMQIDLIKDLKVLEGRV
tara:strand:- start:22 stop:276 length:255 start_codon:yes stop_codon:yes gene_type:complete